jgi:putative transposase
MPVTLFEHKYRARSTRLKGWDYRSRGWYFVTICAHNRRPIFGRIVNNDIHLSAVGAIADANLRTLNTHYKNVEVVEQIVMPNHVHAIFMIDGEHCFSPHLKANLSHDSVPPFTSPHAGSLSAIVRSYKAGVTFKARELGFHQTIWQTRFHDHLLRGDKVIAAVREYIRNNPSNWVRDRENVVVET